MKRQLNKHEKNIAQLIESLYPHTSYIHLTKTGFNKSILDATIPLRENLKKCKIYDYSKEKKGARKTLECYFWDGIDFLDIDINLYRSETRGDYRLSISKLKNKIRTPNITLAFIIVRKRLHIVDITSLKLKDVKDVPFFKNINLESVAKELLGKLKMKTSKWIASTKSNDKAVGETLENLLSIKPNSSKRPDYKGIEIKTNRKQSKSKSNLFSKCPCWGMSRCKNGKEIVLLVGKESRFQNTVVGNKFNSNNVTLRVNYKKETLDEIQATQKGERVILRWHFEDLLYSLHKKHRETFWVKAETRKKKGIEYFLYYKVIHTKSPLLETFFELIESGGIVLEHTHSKDGTRDHGYLFKVLNDSFTKLFPSPVEYNLQSSKKLKLLLRNGP